MGTRDRVEYNKQRYIDNKERHAEQMKQYRTENKEKIAEQGKRYYIDNKEKFAEYWENNKEKIAERMKQYYIDNKEKIAEQKKQYAKDNAEKRAEYNKQWHKDNAEYLKGYVKQWRRDNAEQIKQWNKDNAKYLVVKAQRRRAMKQLLISDFTTEQWEACLEYFNNSDAYTGLPMDIPSQDHIVPVSKGGNYTISNIIPCDKRINSSKGNRDMLTWFRKQTFYDIERENKILAYLAKNTSGYGLI